MLKNYHPQHMSGFQWEEGSSGCMAPVLPYAPNCKCNLNAKGVVVKKEGPNKGKSFWACSLPQSEQCKFFEWEEKKQQNGNNKKRKIVENSSPSPDRESSSSSSSLSTRTVALNLLAEKISQLESDLKEIKTKHSVLYDAIQNARVDIQSLTKYVQKLLDK